ncbi:MAG: polysaccharide biosynthesis protein [Candidatus Pacebacteria bacterium]|jgi:UDP-glucose 4-epimerase|nr:UDP-glucose 4-epimerase [bacterium]MDP6528011.1 polysaccharide biosynthesis protein [Candidatus Paceibacterota bacterium]MDP6659690.1 polysaccharide biosynthesis protein [Candidatus Paceibacterota bacterium]|tara:strand:- start:38711 stop:39703 length:993 start_codon:yes stop_codon:yes gene_type:complete
MKKLLITGGTGSFGNAVLRRFFKDKSISDITIFSRDELKQHEMRHQFSDPRVRFIVGDVRDRDAVKAAAKGVDYIFHAAALKHVPTGEYFPMELVRTNVLGTDNVLTAAEESGVKKVVVLSTDKAAYPINAMGMTKALAEKLIASRARDAKNTTFCAVRYGNVMASRGSVIPLFVDQIKKGKSVTVTDPNMTRFLISLDDSLDLVELAIKKGKPGNLFIKKAPAATMSDLAQALVNIFGAKNKVKVIGTRAGEKIHETLATAFELATSEDLGDYYRIQESAAFGYSQFYKKGAVNKVDNDYTSETTERLTVPKIEKLLRSLDYIKEELKK